MKIFLMAVLLITAVWWANDTGTINILNASIQDPPQQVTELTRAGDECVAISEKASAHLIPKLEFQRLELIARKANVVVRCMADRHFEQNPAWLEYMQPIAAKISLEQRISTDEAIENLKRADMLVFKPDADKPVYWRYVKNNRQ